MKTVVAPPPRVLLVEDDQYLLGLYASKLTAENFKVFSAGDGLSAIRMQKEHQPQIIVLDLNLPEMNGLEALDVMRNDFDQRPPLCLILSNYDRDVAAIPDHLSDVVAAYFVKIKTTPQEVITTIKKLYQDRKNIINKMI